MPCAECESLAIVSPGAMCRSCVSTLLYLHEQDEACLENLWAYLKEAS
jgi:hypothetical protein